MPKLDESGSESVIRELIRMPRLPKTSRIQGPALNCATAFDVSPSPSVNLCQCNIICVSIRVSLLYKLTT